MNRNTLDINKTDKENNENTIDHFEHESHLHKRYPSSNDHQEIISKSQAGKTFSMNVDNFVKELEFILKNYARLSDNARKFALENDWSNMANRILDVYDELI